MIEIDNINVKTIDKVIDALNTSDWEALLLFGFDNIQYAGGAFLPFTPYRKDFRICLFVHKNAESIYICPEELVSSAKKLGEINNVYGYKNDGFIGKQFVNTIAKIIEKNDLLKKGKKIGIDFDRIDHYLFTLIQKTFTTNFFIPIDKWIKDLRMQKTLGEVELLSQIAYTTDHAINGCLHHTIGNRKKSMLSLAEDFRIHAIERGLYETGYNSVAQVSKTQMNDVWPECSYHGWNYGFSPVEQIRDGDFVKIRLASTSDGYWSNACRLFSYDELSEEHKKGYEKWVEIRNYILSIIKIGCKCSEIFIRTKEYARKNKIEFDELVLLGHSIGITPVEPPFISGTDDTILTKNMVLVISPAVLHNGESIQSNETIVVDDDGVRLVNWWKDWREPYTAIPVI